MKRPLIFLAAAGLLASCATKPATTAETPAPAPAPKKEEAAPVQPVAFTGRPQSRMAQVGNDLDLPSAKEFDRSSDPAPPANSTVRITPPVEPKDPQANR